MTEISQLDARRKRLHFRCWHRGTKESDLLLGRFADRYIETLDERSIGQLEALLDQNDIDLYRWITGLAPWPANIANEMTEALSRYCAAGEHL